MNSDGFSYLYVFNYSVPAIYEIELTKEDNELLVEDVLKKHGYRESDCHFMYSQEKLEITPIKE